jgi:predicted nucleic acid-binding protein
MKIYAFDTNIVSYFLNKNEKIIAKLKREKANGNKLIIPPMVYYESVRGLLYLNASSKLKIFEKICSKGIGTMNKKLLDIAVSIYITLKKQGITIEDNDILIAAYCLKYDLTLITNNVDHFKNIDGLAIENWI